MAYVTYHRNYGRPTNCPPSLRQKRFNNKAIKKKIKTIYHVTKKDLVETAHEYSQNSSLHGLRYVGNKDLHVLER